MKHIKLLGILTILIIITEFVLSIPSGMESFQEGMEAGMQEATACKNNAQTPLPHPIKVTVQVSPVNAPLQTVTLNCGQNRPRRLYMQRTVLPVTSVNQLRTPY